MKTQKEFEFTETTEGLPLDKQKRRKHLSERLDVPFGKIQDGFMTALAGEPMVDIVKLDDLLQQKHGNFECSIDELLEREYGEQTVKLLDSIL